MMEGQDPGQEIHHQGADSRSVSLLVRDGNPSNDLASRLERS